MDTWQWDHRCHYTTSAGTPSRQQLKLHVKTTAHIGTMRRLNLALLAALQLGNAHARSFTVHEDLLAFPQVCAAALL